MHRNTTCESLLFRVLPDPLNSKFANSELDRPSTCGPQVLRSYDGDDCVLGDMTTRLPSQVRLELDKTLRFMREQDTVADKDKSTALQMEMVRRAAKILRGAVQDMRSGSGNVEQKQWCYRHSKECPVWPAVPDSAIKMNVAGICCQDWSVRGRRQGSLGDTIIPWCAYIWSILMSEPDIVLCECTQLYRHDDLSACLGHDYHLTQVVFSVTDLGIPCQRNRKYMTLIRKSGKLTWKPGLEMDRDKLMNIFGRRLCCTGHIFLDHTPKQIRRAFVDSLVTQKHWPERDGRGQRWPQRALLSRQTLERLHGFEVEAGRQGQQDKAELFFDISQTPRFGSITSAIPALLRNSCPWSYKYDREVVPHERLEAMGLPCIEPEQTIGCSMPFENIIPQITARAWKSMTGNAMHVAAIGVVMMYSLSCCDVQMK